MKVALTSVFVNDQEKAKTFYTETLGLKLRQDAAYGPGVRWITVVSPEDENGVELLLAQPSDENGSREFQKRQYETGKPALSLKVKDINTTYQELVKKGVKFTTPRRALTTFATFQRVP